MREGQSLDILPVKKEAKVSASEVPGEVVGSGEEDLRCRSLLTVCQRRLGLSEAEDTRLGHCRLCYFFSEIWSLNADERDDLTLILHEGQCFS